MTATEKLLMKKPNNTAQSGNLNSEPLALQSPPSTIEAVNLKEKIYIHTFINSCLFPIGVGRNYRTPPAMILTYSSRLVHLYKYILSYPRASCANRVNVGSYKASPCQGCHSHLPFKYLLLDNFHKNLEIYLDF